jgi:hypothetical protein
MGRRAFRLSRFCNQWSVQRWDQLWQPKKKACLNFLIMLTPYINLLGDLLLLTFFFSFLRDDTQQMMCTTTKHFDKFTTKIIYSFLDIWVLRVGYHGFWAELFEGWVASYYYHHCTTFTTQSWGPKTLNLTSVGLIWTLNIPAWS